VVLVILKDYNLEFLKHIIKRSGREGVGNRRSRARVPVEVLLVRTRCGDPLGVGTCISQTKGRKEQTIINYFNKIRDLDAL
jgi:hypothetical protein